MVWGNCSVAGCWIAGGCALDGCCRARIDGMHMVVASWVPAFVGCSCSVVGWSTLWCSWLLR